MLADYFFIRSLIRTFNLLRSLKIAFTRREKPK